MTIIWLVAIAGLGAYILITHGSAKWYPFWYALLPSLVVSIIPVNPLLQIVLYILMAIAGYILWKIPVQEETYQENKADKLIKQPGIVEEDITGKKVGKVKVLRNIWKAKDISGKGIKKGEYVIVEAVNGDVLVVKRVKKK